MTCLRELGVVSLIQRANSPAAMFSRLWSALGLGAIGTAARSARQRPGQRGIVGIEDQPHVVGELEHFVASRRQRERVGGRGEIARRGAAQYRCGERRGQVAAIVIAQFILKCNRRDFA